MEREWFAVRTQPRKEQLARTHFERQGFTLYLPLVMATRRHARRVERLPRPLFPGYLFLHLAPEERQWHTVAGTIGAVGPVRFGDHFPPVPDWVIEAIRSREDENSCVVLGDLAEDAFRPGDRVLVAWQNYDEIQGIFQARRGEDRAIILIELLRRQVRALVPFTALRAA